MNRLLAGMRYENKAEEVTAFGAYTTTRRAIHECDPAPTILEISEAINALLASWDVPKDQRNVEPIPVGTFRAHCKCRTSSVRVVNGSFRQMCLVCASCGVPFDQVLSGSRDAKR